MIEKYFGLKETPLTRSMPVSDLFRSQAWQELPARLDHIVRSRALGVITGEVEHETQSVGERPREATSPWTRRRSGKTSRNHGGNWLVARSIEDVEFLARPEARDVHAGRDHARRLTREPRLPGECLRR
jgi:hypothetical protein